MIDLYWKVEDSLPERVIIRLEREKLRAFLYCPSSREIEHYKHWFEAEVTGDSFSNQLNSIIALNEEEGRINFNAAQLAKPAFDEAIHEWKKSVHHGEKIPNSDHSLYLLPFAPFEDQHCWQAWQVVIKTVLNRECRHRRGLLAIYRVKLEAIFFQGLDLNANIRNSYLAGFRSQLFNKYPQSKGHQSGRWEQAESARLLYSL